MIDLVSVLAILSVIGTITVFVVLGFRVTRLMKTCNSEDL